MTGRTDPLRTHALVVAVEEYTDADWNIAGPYADACAFMSWLVDRCSVPAGNVTFFSSALSPSLSRTDGTPRLPAGVASRPADSATLPPHLQEHMMSLEADLLWVFWSGHGLIDAGGSHVLLLADSTEHTKRVVAVDDLQLALQSTRIGRNKGTGVKKVAVAVNACQNQPRDETISRFEVGANHSYVTERGLFVMHACSTGQLARLAPTDIPVEGEAASLFPRAVLEFLDDGSCGVLPDLHRVSERVDKEFARLREAGLTWQSPSLLRRNWDGRTTASGDFQLSLTEQEKHLATLLDGLLPDDAARNACAERLAARVPIVIPVSDGTEAPTSGQLVASADRVPHGVATLLDVLAVLPKRHASKEAKQAVRAAGWQLRPDEFLTGDEFAELMRLLAAPAVPDPCLTAKSDRRLRHHAAATGDTATLLRSLEATGCRTEGDSPPPLFRLVAALAAESGPTGRRLVKWSIRVAKRIGVKRAVKYQLAVAEHEAERRRRAKAWLLVRIEIDNPDADTGCGRYRHSAWLIDPAHPRPQTLQHAEGTQFMTWRHTQLLLAELIEPWADSRLGTGETGVDLGVEFFLPGGQLELQVERIPVRYRGVENVPLGQVVSVVVRYAHRRTAWHDRWNACSEDKAPGDHLWLRHDAADLPFLKTRLANSPRVGCVELEGTCAEFTPALAYCAEAGVPVMTWHRRLDGARPTVDLRELRTVVHPRKLPEEVRQLRGEGDTPSRAGKNHLVLLWDDPGRLPPRIRPRVPGRVPPT